MASYNSILRHVSMTDVKRNTKKLQEQKLVEELYRKKELETLLNKNSPLYSNWRFDLDEGMTTQAFTYASTLPSEGDTVLTDVPATDDAMQSQFGLVADGEIKFGTVEPGGGQYGQNWYQWGTTTTYDTSLLSHLSFRLTVGTGNNAPLPAHPLKVQFYGYNGDGGEFDTSFDFGTIVGSLLSSGEYNFELPPEARKKSTSFQFKVDTFDISDNENYRTDYLSRLAMGRNFWGATIADTASAARIWDIVNNDWADDDYKSTSITLLIWDFYSGREYGGYDPWPVSGETGGHTEADRLYLWDWIKDNFSDLNGNYARTFTVSNIGLKRKTPLTVFVPLDNPESSSFVRTGEFSKLSNEQKIKKLREMMNASDQYLLNKFGDSFPGTNADREFTDPSQAPSWEQAAEVDYSQDLTPLSKNPYGTELYQTAMDQAMGELGLLGLSAEAISGLIGLGVAGVMAVTNLSYDAAEWLINNWEPDMGRAERDAQDYERGTSEQQKQETAAADKQLQDATAELEAANASGDPERIKRAEERRANAVKNRQRVRNKWKTNRQHQKNSYEPEGEMIVERKLKNPKAFFQDKDIKPEFPENPPPPQIKGLHPDLVTGEKTAQRFNKLDPISARAMPRTGIKAIDKKVKKAKRLPK